MVKRLGTSKPRKKRATAEEMEERLEFIITSIIEGKRNSELKVEVIKKYQLTEVGYYTHLKQAKQRLKLSRNVRIEELIHKQVAAYEHLYECFQYMDQQSLCLTVMEYKEKVLKLSEIGKTGVLDGEEESESDQLIDQEKINPEEREEYYNILSEAFINEA